MTDFGECKFFFPAVWEILHEKLEGEETARGNS